MIDFIYILIFFIVIFQKLWILIYSVQVFASFDSFFLDSINIHLLFFGGLRIKEESLH